MATKKPYLILYSRAASVSKSVAPPAKKPKGSGATFESDIAKAVKLLRKGGDGGMPMALPAAPPAMRAPARVPSALPHAAPVSAAEKHLATGPKATASFTHDEMSLPHARHSRQLTKDPAELMQHAARHKDYLDNLIDRGKGLSAQLGMHVVEGRHATPEDYDKAHKMGGMVMIAPLKGEKRMRQKAEDKYDGDHSRMRDLSRASVAVSHPDDIPHVVHHLRQAGMKLGSQPDDRFAEPTEAGYSDMQTEVVDPHGHRGELQIHSLDHLQAKEHGFHGVAGGSSGHKMFEEIRDMAGKPMTPELTKRKEDLNAASKQLYGEASRRAAARTPRFAQAGVAKSVVPSHRFRGTRGITSSGNHHKMPNHHGNTAQQALQPGYFSWDGVPAKREGYAETPKFFNGKEWKHVDEGKFAHEARRITEHEFEEMVALRKHQHEQHMASAK